MKSTIISILFLGLLISANAQIKVATNNNVGIASTNPLSILSVNSEGNSLYNAHFYGSGTERTARFYRENPTGTNYNYNLVASLGGISTGFKNVALLASIYQSPPHNKRTFGLYARGGNGYNGYNYAVLGSLWGERNGAGIVGSIGTEPYIDGRYAGFFSGDVKISDDLYVSDELWVNGIEVTSDIRLKSDVKMLKSENGEKSNLSNLLELNPIEYKLISQEIDLPESDTLVINESVARSLPEYNTDTTKVHFGLSAQELQQIYPELVSESKDGYLAVNYIGLIPILIEGVKEQQEIIIQLQNDLSEVRSELEKYQIK